MQKGNKILGILLIVSVICTVAVFIIEELRYEGGNISFDEPPILSADTLDLNSATAEELQTLDGIGETTAQKIIDFREQQRPFETVQDLMLINGFGKKKTEAVLGKVYVKHY